MTTIIDDLAKEHARFRRYLVSYREEIGKLARGEDADVRLLELLATYFSRFPDELHHKNEDIVYARLEGKAGARRVFLEDLHEQHWEISGRARRFAEILRAGLNEREASIARIVEEAESYAAILVEHMRREEELLFLPSQALFTESDWEFVNDEIADLYAKQINFDKAREVLVLEELLDNFLRD